MSLNSNALFVSLSLDSRETLLSASTDVDLPVYTVLCEAGHKPQDAFFLTSGFASLVITLPGAGSAEVGVIGREGVVGLMSLLGPASSQSECYMQASGHGYKMPMQRLESAFRESAEIRSCILDFAQQHVTMTSYLAACNKLHAAEPRLARWLLMVQDRLETDSLPLTQEFLAIMLGTRRMTVTTAAHSLQQLGLIEYKRGKVQILDRKRLEQAACECYRHLKLP